jgi:hypothetical protein
MNIYGQVGWRAAASVNPFVTDADALSFITSAAITNTTQQNAINTLVTDLKGYGIWSKMKALYPFVGGNASSHKFNLKDPRDLDAAYRLVFSGGMTHSSTGALPNGTTGYANTFYKPSDGLQNSAHVSYYSRTSVVASNAIDMGSFSGSLYHHAHIKYTGDVMYGLINTSTAVSVSMAGDISQGLYTFSRVSGASIQSYKNGIIKSSSSLTSTTRNTYNIYLGAGNNTGIASQFGTKEMAFASIGEGLTDTESANLYAAVQKFQTTLGRQV